VIKLVIKHYFQASPFLSFQDYQKLQMGAQMKRLFYTPVKMPSLQKSRKEIENSQPNQFLHKRQQQHGYTRRKEDHSNEQVRTYQGANFWGDALV
jgi:hypothetical protein